MKRTWMTAVGVTLLFLGAAWWDQPQLACAECRPEEVKEEDKLCGWVGDELVPSPGQGCGGTPCTINRYNVYNCSDNSSITVCNATTAGTDCANGSCVCGGANLCEDEVLGCVTNSDGDGNHPCGDQVFTEVCDGLDNDGDGAIDEIAYCTEDDYDFRGHITRVGPDGNPFFTCDGGTPTDPGARPGERIVVG